jgi:hypothetical protein
MKTLAALLAVLLWASAALAADCETWSLCEVRGSPVVHGDTLYI